MVELFLNKIYLIMFMMSLLFVINIIYNFIICLYKEEVFTLSEKYKFILIYSLSYIVAYIIY
jgi:hypothetical protein